MLRDIRAFTVMLRADVIDITSYNLKQSIAPSIQRVIRVNEWILHLI